jgi:site-specific recombinase XerD
LRSAELIRLEWEDVNFARGYIQVGKAKAKTATRRLVPIQPNLMQWLAPYRGHTGHIFASEHAADREIVLRESRRNRMAEQCSEAQLATYRLAQCTDAARVALNGAPKLFRNYRELATNKTQRRFNIVPAEAAARNHSASPGAMKTQNRPTQGAQISAP